MRVPLHPGKLAVLATLTSVVSGASWRLADNPGHPAAAPLPRPARRRRRPGPRRLHRRRRPGARADRGALEDRRALGPRRGRRRLVEEDGGLVAHTERFFDRLHRPIDVCISRGKLYIVAYFRQNETSGPGAGGFRRGGRIVEVTFLDIRGPLRREEKVLAATRRETYTWCDRVCGDQT